MKDKRKWLIDQMQKHWYLDEDDIIDGDVKDNAIVEGNRDITFGEVFNFCEQLAWEGIEFGKAEILIDVTIKREISRIPRGFVWSVDEFSIEDGKLRIWFD